MKVLHLIGGDLDLGAARGAYSLHKGLMAIGVDSRILTNSYRLIDDEHVSYIARSRKGKLIALIREQLDILPARFYGKEELFSSGITGFDFTKTKEYKDADIIHLHWINSGFVNVKHLSTIEKPVLWTIRDMWPMTGGCHYAIDCDNYKQDCGYCKQLERKIPFHLSKWVLKRKIKYILRNTRIVGISYWISEKAKESTLFREFNIRTIHNNVNTADFFPINKVTARAILGIKSNKKIILAGAQAQGSKYNYKGFDKLVEAFKRLNNNDYFLTFFGRFDDQKIKDLGFEFKNFGFLYDTISLRTVYSAADVFVAPSIMETFGKTVAESMACGTPAVCFDATGPKDIVEHKISGYKARPFDAIDLAKGITWILESSDYEKLTKNAREKITNAFDSKVIAEKYRKLYEEMLETKHISARL